MADKKLQVGQAVQLKVGDDPVAALVTKVNEDGTVNLVTFGPEGQHNSVSYVTDKSVKVVS
jgi:hypothetical protein